VQVASLPFRSRHCEDAESGHKRGFGSAAAAASAAAASAAGCRQQSSNGSSEEQHIGRSVEFVEIAIFKSPSWLPSDMKSFIIRLGLRRPCGSGWPSASAAAAGVEVSTPCQEV